MTTAPLPKSAQRGSSMVEILMSVAFFTVMATASFKSGLISYRSVNNSMYESTAARLAIQRMEQFVSTNPQSLDDTDDQTQTVTVDGLPYNVITEVTINSDRARTVKITVYPDNQHIGGFISLQNSFALWGKR